MPDTFLEGVVVDCELQMCRQERSFVLGIKI